ncbi:MAG: hypothetical protein GXP62_11065, partial [Oligoflexia bacterium]|nr:hypothetical protein [Oligoflexia bacterium]
GADHTCSLQADGYANCWGNSALGATVPPNNRFRSLSAGTGFTCGLTTKREPLCWGRDDLVTDTGIPATSPVIPASGDYSLVEAGDGFACGAGVKSGVTCWGDTEGWPDLFSDTDQYAQLSLAAGEACGLKIDGSAWCAMLSQAGQSLSGVILQVSAGVGHACALATGGALSCWALDDASAPAVSGP